jgi:hypothetical protein
VTFWCGSGTADPYLHLFTNPDLDPDPALFVASGAFKNQDANKNNFFKQFFCKTEEIKGFLAIFA